jgi:hypothetical protein
MIFPKIDKSFTSRYSYDETLRKVGEFINQKDISSTFYKDTYGRGENVIMIGNIKPSGDKAYLELTFEMTIISKLFIIVFIVFGLAGPFFSFVDLLSKGNFNTKNFLTLIVPFIGYLFLYLMFQSDALGKLRDLKRKLGILYEHN